MYGYAKPSTSRFFTRYVKLRRLSAATLSAAMAVFALTLNAETLLQNITLSPDTSLILDSEAVHDENAAEDDLRGSVSLINIGFVPSSTDLNAYHRLNKTDQLVSFDTTLNFGRVVVEPGDVLKISFNGVSFSYQIVFDASVLRVPSGVMVDAIGVWEGDLILSFDTSVFIGFSADDEDLVRFDTEKGFSKFFDGSNVGLSTTLDVDGVHVLNNGNLLLSLDGSGSIGRTRFDDEDILEYSVVSNTWQLVYDGSVQHAGLQNVDVNAIAATQVSVPACEGDIDGDGDVDGSDLSVFSGDFGRTDCSVGPACEGDFDSDGDVDGSDLAVFSEDFGRTDCP